MSTLFTPTLWRVDSRSPAPGTVPRLRYFPRKVDWVTALSALLRVRDNDPSSITTETLVVQSGGRYLSQGASDGSYSPVSHSGE